MQVNQWLLAQGPDSTSSLYHFLSENFGIVILVLVLVAILLSAAMSLFNKIHRRNAEIELKRDMLDRGMSADEIERVLAAKISAK